MNITDIIRLVLLIISLLAAFVIIGSSFYYHGWSKGWDAKSVMNSDFHQGFNDGWEACKDYMLRNESGNYNEVKQERKDDE